MGAKRVRVDIREMADMVGIRWVELRIYAAKYKYAFLTPVKHTERGLEPRTKKRTGYVAFFTKDKKLALVFTNSKYLKERDYAIEVTFSE